jgi:hypothetical protein
MLGAHPLDPRVLEGATYEQTSTALAWTLWGYRQALSRGERIENVPGYFVRVLASCKRGEKSTRGYWRDDLVAIVYEGTHPNALWHQQGVRRA